MRIEGGRRKVYIASIISRAKPGTRKRAGGEASNCLVNDLGRLFNAQPYEFRTSAIGQALSIILNIYRLCGPFPTEPRKKSTRRRKPQQNGQFPLLIADQFCRIRYRSSRVACWLCPLVSLPDRWSVFQQGADVMGNYRAQMPVVELWPFLEPSFLPSKAFQPVKMTHTGKISISICPRGKGSLVRYARHGHTGVNVCDTESIFGDKMRLQGLITFCDLYANRNSMDNKIMINGIVLTRVVSRPDQG